MKSEICAKENVRPCFVKDQWCGDIVARNRFKRRKMAEFW